MATNVTADGRSRVLADGNEIPLLGLGVWQVDDGRACEDAVRWALELGYRHIDTAQAYRNERSVGKALRDSGVARDEVFITTKFYPAKDDPEVEAQRSLERLGLDYVDLYIIHWPQGGPTWAWDGMQRAQAAGYARSIGVSNFSARELDELLAISDVDPGRQPGPVQPVRVPARAAGGGEERQIALEAYSPLGTGRHLGDPRVARDRGAARPHAGAGPDPLGAAAQPDRAAEVDAPRAHRGQRAGLRLHALRGGRGRAGRARPHRRDRRRARERVVVR